MSAKKTILEVFFDYACPYCLEGHIYLKELLPDFPEIDVVWRPCEAHPRPEDWGPHTDLCARGMFIAQEKGADLWAYHDAAYKAGVSDKADIENAGVLAGYTDGILDAGAFCGALNAGAYEKELEAANDYAYEQSGVWTVPAYRMNGKRLDAVGGVGVTKAQLKAFLSGAEEV